MRDANGSETVGYREGKIPEATVQRLSIYLRYVTQLHRDEVKVVSSYALSKGCGVLSLRTSIGLASLPRWRPPLRATPSPRTCSTAARAITVPALPAG